MTDVHKLPNGQFAISQNLLDWINESRRIGMSDDDIRSQFARAQTTLHEPATAEGDEEVSVTTAVQVSWDKIVNAIVGAIEGGSGYWLFEFCPNKESQDAAAAIREKGEIWYAENRFWTEGGRASLRFDNPEGEDDWACKAIGKAEIISGLAIMANKYPVRFAELIDENDDADTHDVFIQCVVLKEVVFG